MKKTFLIILSIVLAITIAIDAFLLVSGSLEAFPSAEQIEKGSIVYGSFLVLLTLVEAFILTRFFKRK